MRKTCLFVVGGLLIYHHLGLCVDAWTASVASPVELRKAFDDHNVDRIFLLDSMYLREYNGWDLDRDGPIRLNRSVVIEGDAQWNRLIVMDFDTILMNNQKFFEPEVEGMTLTFIKLHLAGLPIVQGSLDSYRANMSYIFEHCLLEIYYPAQGSAPDWPAWIDLERAQEYPANFETEDRQQLISPAEKEFCNTWCEVECPDAMYVYMEDTAFYFGSVNPKLAQEFGFNLEETGILRCDDTMLLLVGLDERTPYTTEAFEAALQSTDGHRTVVIIDNYLKLSRTNQQCGTQLQRNTIIRGSSNNVPPLSLLDFNLIINCTAIPDGVSLTIKDLLLNNSAIDAAVARKSSPWQTVAGFFTPAAGAIINIDNVVWRSLSSVKKPLSAGSISGDLKERGRVTMDRSDIIDIKTKQEVDTRSTEWCTSSFISGSPSCVKNENCRKQVRCPHRAVQIGDVSYEFPSKVGPGNAFYHITGSLIIPIFIESPEDVIGPRDPELNNPPGTPKEKTPVLIILILVGLGAVGFTVAAVALTLAKLRHKHPTVDNSCADSEYELGNYNSGYSDFGTGKEKSSGTQILTSSKPNSIARSEMSHFSKVAQRAAEKMFGNIILGDLLGQGGFGRVYKATWNGAVVAVKVIDIGSESPNQESSIQREVDLLLGLRHPNIVNLYQAASRPVGSGYSHESLSLKEMEDSNTPGSISSGSNPPNQFSDGNMEAWLVMEFCDKGTLRDLIRNGFFFVDATKKEINMGCVIGTCQDIARGFQYLHEQSMIHGDLKPHNILLQTSSQDARGFTAKIADFGVSRKIQGSQMYTGTVGTMTYMPPELLGSSKISSKTDVYAFGLIMWELTTGEAPFGMVTVADIWRKVVIEHYRPAFASNIPAGYVNLATMCWDNDPKLRPTFDQVQNELTVLLAAMK